MATQATARPKRYATFIALLPSTRLGPPVTFCRENGGIRATAAVRYTLYQLSLRSREPYEKPFCAAARHGHQTKSRGRYSASMNEIIFARSFASGRRPRI